MRKSWCYAGSAIPSSSPLSLSLSLSLSCWQEHKGKIEFIVMSAVYLCPAGPLVQCSSERVTKKMRSALRRPKLQSPLVFPLLVLPKQPASYYRIVTVTSAKKERRRERTGGGGGGTKERRGKDGRRKGPPLGPSSSLSLSLSLTWG